MRFSLMILVTLFTAHSFAADITAAPSGSLPNLRIVNANIFRGGRPTQAGLEWLALLGVKTIINLEDTNRIVDAEMAAATKLGINERSYQTSAYWAPPAAKMNQIQADLQNPDLYPIYIHCHHGEDRTGFIMGVYRVNVEHWTQQAAYNEMLADGFHTSFVLINRKFFALTTH